MARVVDQSCRYRRQDDPEVLFLPLPSELRQDVKPFVDVTVDRLSRGLGALIMLVLIQPWGLALAWYQLSFVSLALTIAWYFVAFRAKREYLASFRRSIATGVVKPEELRLRGSELSTVEALVQELAHPDPLRVTYRLACSSRWTSESRDAILLYQTPESEARAVGARCRAGATSPSNGCAHPPCSAIGS